MISAAKSCQGVRPESVCRFNGPDAQESGEFLCADVVRFVARSEEGFRFAARAPTGTRANIQGRRPWSDCVPPTLPTPGLRFPAGPVPHKAAQLRDQCLIVSETPNGIARTRLFPARPLALPRQTFFSGTSTCPYRRVLNVKPYSVPRIGSV